MKLLPQIKKYTLTGDKKVNITIKEDKIYKIDNQKAEIKIEALENDEYMVHCNKNSHVGEVVSLKQNEVTVMINGNTYHFTIDTEYASKRKERLSKTQSKKIEKTKAPLPGEIVAVLMSEGQEVHKGEPVLILEAMKMQNEIVSPITGRIKSVSVKAAETVMKDQILFEVEPAK